MILSASFKPVDGNFAEALNDLVSLLDSMSNLRYFAVGYDTIFGEPSIESSEFISGFKALNEDQNPDNDAFFFSVASADDFKQRFLIDFTSRRKIGSLSTLVIQWWEPMPSWARQIDLFIQSIDTIISWKRPQHLRCGPPLYFVNDHPLDKARSGIGWLGWVPFDLSQAEVPEAAMLLPIQGGTFLASQRDWWIAAGPQRDVAAVQRAQALELRLNAIGVLPTNIELQRGDWGQGGVRP